MLRRPVVTAALAVGAAAALIAAVKCQFRAQLLLAATGMVMLAFRSRWMLRLAAWGALGVMVVFPTLFTSNVGNRVVDLLEPERILTAIGSSHAGAFDLSERTLLYHYGWDNLRVGPIALFGEGPMLRDAQGGIGDQGKEGYRMPYHAALLDFFMQSGVIIGVTVIAWLGMLLRQAFKRLDALAPQATNERFLVVAGVINLTLWLSVSVVDSGLSNLETFWLAVAPLFGALATTGRGQAPAKFPAAAVDLAMQQPARA
jgi:hypothetical protein